MAKVLYETERAQFERDGFFVAEQLFRPEEMDALMDRAAYYVEHPKDGIRVQIEPHVASGEKAASSRLDSVRKIEELVANDDHFLRFAQEPRVLERFQAILDAPVRLFRDAFMWKPARVGSAKPYHQDSAYWRIEPMSLCSMWVALEDSTVENGCMRVIPGSQKGGVIEHKHLEDFMVTDDQIDVGREQSVEMTKGSALFFHSLLLHATSPNTSDRSRRAMILSCMGPRHHWSGNPSEEPNWLILG